MKFVKVSDDRLLVLNRSDSVKHIRLNPLTLGANSVTIMKFVVRTMDDWSCLSIVGEKLRLPPACHPSLVDSINLGLSGTDIEANASIGRVWLGLHASGKLKLTSNCIKGRPTLQANENGIAKPFQGCSTELWCVCRWADGLDSGTLGRKTVGTLLTNVWSCSGIEGEKLRFPWKWHFSLVELVNLSLHATDNLTRTSAWIKRSSLKENDDCMDKQIWGFSAQPWQACPWAKCLHFSKPSWRATVGRVIRGLKERTSIWTSSIIMADTGNTAFAFCVRENCCPLPGKVALALPLDCELLVAIMLQNNIDKHFRGCNARVWKLASCLDSNKSERKTFGTLQTIDDWGWLALGLYASGKLKLTSNCIKGRPTLQANENGIAKPFQGCSAQLWCVWADSLDSESLERKTFGTLRTIAVWSSFVGFVGGKLRLPRKWHLWRVELVCCSDWSTNDPCKWSFTTYFCQQIRLKPLAIGEKSVRVMKPSSFKDDKDESTNAIWTLCIMASNTPVSLVFCPGTNGCPFPRKVAFLLPFHCELSLEKNATVSRSVFHIIKSFHNSKTCCSVPAKLAPRLLSHCAHPALMTLSVYRTDKFSPTGMCLKCFERNTHAQMFPLGVHSDQIPTRPHALSK